MRNTLVPRLSLVPLLVGATLFACGGEEDTAECKSMRAEVEAQAAEAKEQVEAARTALTAALVALPVTSKDPCTAEDIQWQEFTTISDGKVEGVYLPEPFYLGRYESAAKKPHCANRGSDNIKGTHKLFSDEVARMKAGNRLYFVDAERVSPELLSGKKFKGGHVHGWLLVWSYAEKKFICGAEARAESGPSLYSSAGAVKNSKDLDEQLTSVAVRNGIKSLRKIDFAAKPVPFAEAVKGAGGDAASSDDAASLAKIHDSLRAGKKILAVKEYRANHEVPLAVALLAVEVEAVAIGLPSKERARNLYWDGKPDEAKAELKKLYGEAQSSAALAEMKDELGPATEENFNAKLAAKEFLVALKIYHRLHPELSIVKAHEAVRATQPK